MYGMIIVLYFHPVTFLWPWPLRVLNVIPLYDTFVIPSKASWQSSGWQLSPPQSRQLIRRKQLALTFNLTFAIYLVFWRILCLKKASFFSAFFNLLEFNEFICSYYIPDIAYLYLMYKIHLLKLKNCYKTLF